MSTIVVLQYKRPGSSRKWGKKKERKSLTNRWREKLLSTHCGNPLPSSWLAGETCSVVRWNMRRINPTMDRSNHQGEHSYGLQKTWIGCRIAAIAFCWLRVLIFYGLSSERVNWRSMQSSLCHRLLYTREDLVVHFAPHLSKKTIATMPVNGCDYKATALTIWYTRVFSVFPRHYFVPHYSDFIHLILLWV